MDLENRRRSTANNLLTGKPEFILVYSDFMLSEKMEKADQEMNTKLNSKPHLKVHKIEIFFGFDFEICIISVLVMSKY